MVVVCISVMLVAALQSGVDGVWVDATSTVPLTVPAFGIWHELNTMVTPARDDALGEPLHSGPAVFGFTVTLPGQIVVSPRASARMRSPTAARRDVVLLLPASVAGADASAPPAPLLPPLPVMPVMPPAPVVPP